MTLRAERPELAKFAPVVARLRRDGATYLGMASPTIDIEQYLPQFYSDVVKLAICENGRVSCAYLKIVKLRESDSRETIAGKLESLFRRMSHLHQSMAGIPGLSAVRPIACFPEHLAIVTEEAPGRTLLDRLGGAAAWWPPAAASIEPLAVSLSRVGAWLRRFHELSAHSADRLSLQEMRAYLDVRLRLFSGTHHLLDEHIRSRLLVAFDERARRVHESDLALAPIHADFAFSNIVVDGTNVVVLDFSVPAYGAVYHDVSHLHMHLGLLTAKPAFRPAVVARLQRALLQGFDPALETGHPLFEMLALQHTACHLTGLAQNPAGPVARIYNRLLIRRHLRWLSDFASVRVETSPA